SATTSLRCSRPCTRITGPRGFPSWCLRSWHAPWRSGATSAGTPCSPRSRACSITDSSALPCPCCDASPMQLRGLCSRRVMSSRRWGSRSPPCCCTEAVRNLLGRAGGLVSQSLARCLPAAWLPGCGRGATQKLHNGNLAAVQVNSRFPLGLSQNIMLAREFKANTACAAESKQSSGSSVPANPGNTARIVTLPELSNPILNRAAAEMPVLAPPPATAPAPPAPAERPPSRRRWWIGALILAAIAVAVTVAVTLRSRGSSTQGTESVRTAVIERRDFVRTLRITGTVEATQSYIVAAPSLTGGGFGSMVIPRLATAGSKVKKGDLLVEFDRQAQIKNALDKRAEYRDLVEQIKKKQAELAIARVKDETELKQAEDAVRAAELEVSRNEVVSRIDAEKNQANLEEARARLKQLQETFQLKRRAAQAELRVLEIQRDRARRAMVHAERNAEKMAVRAPLDGTVVLNTIWKSGQMGEVQEGDEVRAGVPFM